MNEEYGLPQLMWLFDYETTAMKSKVAGTSFNRAIYGKEGKLQELQRLITNNASYC